MTNRLHKIDQTGDMAVDEFGVEAFDDHLRAVRIRAGHERADKTACGGAAKAHKAFRENDFLAASGGADGGGQTGGTAADHENVGVS